MNNFFSEKHFHEGLVRQAYQGGQIMSSEPFSFHSTALSQLPPFNGVNVYVGFLRSSASENLTISVRGQTLVLVPEQFNTVVFFDSMSVPVGNIQFIGFRFTLAFT